MPARLINSLIYVSTARAGLSLNDFLEIMTVSQNHNKRLGITGLLVFNGINFMQCLEGDRAATNDRLRHIGLDDRHSGLSVVDQRELPDRQFAGWHMAGRYLPAEQGLEQADLSTILADKSVSDVTRSMFQSVLSFGGKSPGQ